MNPVFKVGWARYLNLFLFLSKHDAEIWEMQTEKRQLFISCQQKATGKSLIHSVTCFQLFLYISAFEKDANWIFRAGRWDNFIQNFCPLFAPAVWSVVPCPFDFGLGHMTFSNQWTMDRRTVCQLMVKVFLESLHFHLSSCAPVTCHEDLSGGWCSFSLGSGRRVAWSRHKSDLQSAAKPNWATAKPQPTHEQ